MASFIRIVELIKNPNNYVVTIQHVEEQGWIFKKFVEYSPYKIYGKGTWWNYLDDDKVVSHYIAEVLSKIYDSLNSKTPATMKEITGQLFRLNK